MLVKAHKINNMWMKDKLEAYLKDKYGILTTNKLYGMTIMDTLLQYYIPEEFIVDLLNIVKQEGIKGCYDIVDKFLYNTLQSQLVLQADNFDEIYAS